MKFTKKKKIIFNKTKKNRDLFLIKNANSIFDSQKDKQLITTLSNEFEKHMIHSTSTIPSLFKKYKYYNEIQKGDNYVKLFVIDNNQHKCILDLEKLGHKYDFFSPSSIEFSNNEEFIIFSVDFVGDRYHTIFMKHYFDDTVIKLIDSVDGNTVISPNNNEIYYLKMNKSMRPYQLYSYNVQTKKHSLIYTEKDHSFSLSVHLTNTRSHVLLHCESWNSSHTYMIQNNTCTLLYKKEKDLYYSVLCYQDYWYFMILKKNISKIIYTNNFKNYHTLLPNKNEIEYNNFIIKGNFLCAVFRKNGQNNLINVNLLTKKTKTIHFNKKNQYSFDFPELSNLNLHDSNVIINVSSHLQSKKVVNLDCVSNTTKLLKNEKIPNYDEDLYESKLLHVNKKLCITIMYKKSKFDKNMKCVLYAYGAYGVEIEPEFDHKIISLLNRGFLYCIAHVRGGGFHGNRWYMDGKLLKKKNTFNDFILCAKYLIKNNYTQSNKLAIWGRSAGGLTIGASLNIEPELFELAILGVPFVDVLNTMKDKSKPLTLEEYKEWGNPNIKKYESYIKSYDPVQNIRPKEKYPSIYIYSNMEDTLVEYKEPLKYYMLMKNVDVFSNNKRKLLMNINMKYGHVQSSKRYENNTEDATHYSIIINQIK